MCIISATTLICIVLMIQKVPLHRDTEVYVKGARACVKGARASWPHWPPLNSLLKESNNPDPRQDHWVLLGALFPKPDSSRLRLTSKALHTKTLSQFSYAGLSKVQVLVVGILEKTLLKPTGAKGGLPCISWIGTRMHAKICNIHYDW